MNPGWCTATSPGALIKNNNQAGWRSVDDTASRAAMHYGSYGFRRQSLPALPELVAAQLVITKHVTPA